MTLSRDEHSRLVSRAALGDNHAMKELKALHPRMDLRRRHCDLRGMTVVCRGKGSKAAWKVLL